MVPPLRSTQRAAVFVLRFKGVGVSLGEQKGNKMLSFETAKRLREAGFPQPETVEDGQFWYSCGQRLWFIQSPYKMGIAPERWFECYPYFAPTAADIMKEIHRLVGQVILLCFDGGEWIVRRDIGLPELEDMTIAHYPDPDEAAVNAFFEAAAVIAQIDAIIAG